MTPRPYQSEGRLAVHKAWQQNKKVLVVWPTGTGKTVLFSLVTSDIVRDGGRVLILAHREELIRQAQTKLAASVGLDSAIEKAGETAYGAFEQVTVGSVQTLMSLSRMERFTRDHYTHIIIDECHHALTDGYQRILSYFENAKVLGVTATPDRGDLRDLGEYFEKVAHEYLLPQAIREGYLSKIRAQMLPLKIDLDGVKCGKDFDDIEVGSALRPYIPQIASELWRTCQNRKLLVFAPLCAIAQEIQKALGAVGFRSYYASGEDRTQMEKYNAEGRGACMTNAMLLTEGYDCPNIDAVCVLRPTKVRALYAQMIGRGTRICPGKDYLLIPDFLWHSERHDLCHPAHLFAESKEVADIMVKKSYESAGGDGHDIDQQAAEDARREFLEARELALAKKLAEQRKKKAKLVDPLQFAVSIGDESLADYEAVMPADKIPATLEQINVLEQMGLSTEGLTMGAAEKALAVMQSREKSKMSLPKQIRLLERYRIKHAGRMTRGDAGVIIGRIQANGWRLPENLRNLT